MIADVPVWVVAALHVVFGLAESVGWNQMASRFGYRGEAIEQTRVLATNQGAYNAGVAALLAWALLTANDPAVLALLVFVVAMAAVGAVTASWTIFVIQGVPALIAIAAQLWAA